MLTLEQFQERLHQEYDGLVALGNKNYEFFLNKAYEYAHYNEIMDYFENMDEEDWKNDWQKLVGKRKENVLSGIWNCWLCYNHPEYYNFFTYEGLCDIMKYYFTHH